MRGANRRIADRASPDAWPGPWPVPWPIPWPGARAGVRGSLAGVLTMVLTGKSYGTLTRQAVRHDVYTRPSVGEASSLIFEVNRDRAGPEMGRIDAPGSPPV